MHAGKEWNCYDVFSCTENPFISFALLLWLQVLANWKHSCMQEKVGEPSEVQTSTNHCVVLNITT